MCGTREIASPLRRCFVFGFFFSFSKMEAHTHEYEGMSGIFEMGLIPCTHYRMIKGDIKKSRFGQGLKLEEDCGE